MNLLKKILNLGVDNQSSAAQNFTTKLLNQIAVIVMVLIVVYMTAHILLKNGWLAVIFDLIPLSTSFLILYFNSKKQFEKTYLTLGIGYTISFAAISLLIGSQNQIEYLLLISSIGTVILLKDNHQKALFFYFSFIIFVSLKIFHVYYPQGLSQKEFSPYFKIFNGSFVFVFMYVIVSRTIKNANILLEKLQARNEEISTLNENLEANVKKRTEALAQSNKELKKFAYISAHDLREPLRNILGFSQLLKKSIAEKDNNETENNLNYINWGVKRIDAITRDIVSYTELEENVREITKVDLNVLIQQIIWETKDKRKDIEFQIEQLPVVNISLKSADILFDNLINNAIQYCDKPTNKITISCYKLDGFYRFIISDTGTGIEPQYFEKIFDMFTRLHNDFNRNGSGTGLAFCKKIVESYGGEIWVESQYKKGSDFYFTLPV